MVHKLKQAILLIEIC